MVSEASGGPEASQKGTSALSRMSRDPLLGLTGDGQERLQVVKTKGTSVSPLPGLIPEGTRESRREERPILALVLPDRPFDVAASQRVRRLFGLFVGNHLVSSFG